VAGEGESISREMPLALREKILHRPLWCLDCRKKGSAIVIPRVDTGMQELLKCDIYPQRLSDGFQTDGICCGVYFLHAV